MDRALDEKMRARNESLGASIAEWIEADTDFAVLWGAYHYPTVEKALRGGGCRVEESRALLVTVWPMLPLSRQLRSEVHECRVTPREPGCLAPFLAC